MALQCRTLPLGSHGAAQSAPFQSAQVLFHVDGKIGCKATQNSFFVLQSHQSDLEHSLRSAHLGTRLHQLLSTLLGNRGREASCTRAFVSPIEAATAVVETKGSEPWLSAEDASRLPAARCRRLLSA